MRELAILTFQTLDGVMQAPATPDEDTSNDFKGGGWAQPYWDLVMQQVAEEAMAEPYDLLLGRKTYDSFASHFAPGGAGEADLPMMTKARKYVVTSSPETVTWNNSVALTGDIAPEIARIKKEDGPLLQVHGSWQLIQLLLAHDLIDEYRLWTFPVLAGSGKRLFAAGMPPGTATLRKTRSTSDGVVMGIYRTTRA